MAAAGAVASHQANNSPLVVPEESKEAMGSSHHHHHLHHGDHAASATGDGGHATTIPEEWIPVPAPEALSLGYIQVDGQPQPFPKEPTPGKLAGRCKWFDLAKGWGFIVRPGADDGHKDDIFVHSSCVSTRPGYKGLADNEPVEFNISAEPNGRLRAINVTAIGGGLALGQSLEELQRRFRVEEPPESRIYPPHTKLPLPAGRMRGSVRSFNATKGFGFLLAPPIAEDIFVHQSDLITAPGNYRSLGIGECVEFTLYEDPATGKKKALHVTGPGGSYCVGVRRPIDHRLANSLAVASHFGAAYPQAAAASAAAVYSSAAFAGAAGHYGTLAAVHRLQAHLPPRQHHHHHHQQQQQPALGSQYIHRQQQHHATPQQQQQSQITAARRNLPQGSSQHAHHAQVHQIHQNPQGQRGAAPSPPYFAFVDGAAGAEAAAAAYYFLPAMNQARQVAGPEGP